MKVVYIFIIFIIVIVSFSAFEEYLTKENLSNVLQLRANVFQEESTEKETIETNKPLTARASKPIQPNNPSPNQIKNETTKKEVIKKETIKEIPTQTEEITDISPYYGKVKISSIQGKTEYRPSLIRLRVNIYPGDKINITGWRVKMRKGEIIIPKGIEKYQTYATPRDIIIKESLYIYLISGSNPLGRDKNFRANKCFGYLKDRYSFYPSIYSYCSRQKLEDISHLRPYCQEFILHVPRCKTIDYLDYSNDIKIVSDMKCRNYIDSKFNYRSCFKDSSKDEDFLTNYWYIYRNTDIIEPLHDTIYLYDHNGLLVDKYMY